MLLSLFLLTHSSVPQLIIEIPMFKSIRKYQIKSKLIESQTEQSHGKISLQERQKLLSYLIRKIYLNSLIHIYTKLSEKSTSDEQNKNKTEEFHQCEVITRYLPWNYNKVVFAQGRQQCIESETWFFLPGENMKEKSILLLDIEPKRSLLKAPPSKKHVNILPKIKS